DDEPRTERGGLARLGIGAFAFGHAAVEKVSKEFLERRARRKLRDLGSGSLAAPIGLQRLRRRDVNYRREKLLGKIREAVRCRIGSRRSPTESRRGDDQQRCKRPGGRVGQL